jgi:hypothetical protein
MGQLIQGRRASGGFTATLLSHTELLLPRLPRRLAESFHSLRGRLPRPPASTPPHQPHHSMGFPSSTRPTRDLCPAPLGHPPRLGASCARPTVARASSSSIMTARPTSPRSHPRLAMITIGRQGCLSVRTSRCTLGAGSKPIYTSSTHRMLKSMSKVLFWLMVVGRTALGTRTP